MVNLDKAILDNCQAVLSDYEADETCQKFADQIKKLVDFDWLAINIVSDDPDYFTIFLHSGQEIPRYPKQSRYPLSGSQTAYVVSTGQTLIRDDFSQGSSFSTDQTFLEAGLRSGIVTPLVCNGQLIGVLSLRSKKIGAYGLTDQDILEVLAPRIASAVENTTRYQKLHTYPRELVVVDQVADIFVSSQNIDEIYQNFTLELQKLISFDRMIINLIDEESGTFTVKFLFGPTCPGRELGAIVPLDGTQSAQMLEKRITVIQDDLSQTPVFEVDKRLAEMGMRSSMRLPLIIQNRIIGGIGLESKELAAFGPKEQTLMERLARQITPRIENIRLHEQVISRTSPNSETRLVDEISRIVTTTLDINEVYQQFARAVKDLVDFDRMSINVINQEDYTYTLKYIAGPTRPSRPVGATSSLQGTQTEYVIRSGKTLVRSNVGEDPRFQSDKDLQASGLISTISTPLVCKGRIIGTLSMRSNRVGAFDTREQAILEHLASQIAPAVENAELYQQLQENIAEKAALDEVAKIVTSTPNLDDGFEKFCERVKKVVPFDRIAINTVNHDDNTYTLSYLSGPEWPEHKLGTSCPLAGTESEYVVSTRQTLRRGATQEDPKFPSDIWHHSHAMNSSIKVPLITKGKVIGVLSLRSSQKDAFGPKEQGILEHLAIQIAPGVDNSELYQQLQASISEKEVVDEVSRLVSSTLSMDEVYEKFSMELRKIVPFDRIGINTIDHINNTYTLKYCSGREWSDRPLGVPTPLTGSQAEFVAKSGKTLVREDTTSGPMFHSDRAPYAADLRASIAVPLISKGQVIGVFSLRSSRAGAFGPREQRILEGLANQIAPGVKNAEMWEQAQRELLLVDKVAQIFTSTLDLDDVFEQFAERLRELVPFDRININFIDATSQTRILKFLYGIPIPGFNVGDRSPLNNTLTQKLIESRRTLIIDRLASKAATDIDQDFIDSGLRSAIGIPLISKGLVVGTLHIHSKEPIDCYGSREQAILERLAGQIAPAIENTHLYEQVKQEMALVDEVAAIVTSTLEIDEVYEKFAAELKKLVPFDRITINLVDEEKGTHTLKYRSGSGDLVLPLGSDVPLKGSPHQQVAQTRQTSIRQDYSNHPEFISDHFPENAGLKASIMVPLITKGRCIGTLGLRSNRENAYGRREQAILERLTQQIAPAVENAELYNDQKLAEQQLRNLFRAVEQSASGVIITDTDGVIQYVNPKFSQTTGYSSEEAIGLEAGFLKSGETPAELYKDLWDCLLKGQEWHGVFLNRRKNGEIYLSEQSISPIREPDGETTHYVSIEEDVTQRTELEEQLLQAQKMETVGRLAGGVAHDFNNLLTAILGYSQMALAESPADSSVKDYIKESITAAERAANLTGQLLAFSRKQVVEPQVLDLNTLILNLDRMLRRLIGEDVELVTLPAENLEPVKLDRGQMEQVLMNMGVNARDAMPQGGRLIIETSNAVLEKSEVHQLPSGKYVVVTVSDTGTGMTKEVQEHLFEPFFTTKGVGEGTGLGMATCYGIITQNGGHIEVFSEEGNGTSFKIYLPCTAELAESPNKTTSPGKLDRGSETVLIAEDEAMVRSMVSTILKDQGYQVIESTNGEEALKEAQSHPGGIDILVTDVIMPTMGGPELAQRIKELRPEIKVLFTSGYTERVNVNQGTLPPECDFIQKPYLPEALLRKMQETLRR